MQFLEGNFARSYGINFRTFDMSIILFLGTCVQWAKPGPTDTEDQGSWGPAGWVSSPAGSCHPGDLILFSTCFDSCSNLVTNVFGPAAIIDELGAHQKEDRMQQMLLYAGISESRLAVKI